MVPSSEFRPFVERMLSALDDPDASDLFAADAEAILAELYAGRDPQALFAVKRSAYNEFAEPIQLTLQFLSLVVSTFKVVKEYSESRRKPTVSADEIAATWEAAMTAQGVPADKAALLTLKFRNDLRALVQR